MNKQIKNDLKEISIIMEETWKGILLSAGITAGILDELNRDGPKSIVQIAKAKNYDIPKIEKWFYYMEDLGIVNIKKDKYNLTAKGNILSSNSPFKDIQGMFQLTEYFMAASMSSKDTFKKNYSLDNLGKGKILGEYRPQVSDKFSNALINQIQKNNILKSDTLLDIGCGKGSFLKTVSMAIPEIKLTGIDSNVLAIEKGREEIKTFNLDSRINLIEGDITLNLSKIQNDTYDWCSAINIFHFVPEKKRIEIIENIIRIAKKGVFMTQVVVEKSNLSRSADPLMSLLWNDYSGFFRQKELENLNDRLIKKYKNINFKTNNIMNGNSNLLVITK